MKKVDENITRLKFIDIPGTENLIIYNILAPQKEATEEEKLIKSDFLNLLFAELKRDVDKGLYPIVLGDFNIHSQELSGGSHANDSFANLLHTEMDNLNLLNVSGLEGQVYNKLRFTDRVMAKNNFNADGVPFTR